MRGALSSLLTLSAWIGRCLWAVLIAFVSTSLRNQTFYCRIPLIKEIQSCVGVNGHNRRCGLAMQGALAEGAKIRSKPIRDPSTGTLDSAKEEKKGDLKL
ncbi:unnamed protein product [Linum trigynum]|uniref:Secreted protein n=1 Tax=Linum trigynum TaxID=586398 RepID=A0AAV2FVR9_9ROSI